MNESKISAGSRRKPDTGSVVPIGRLTIFFIICITLTSINITQAQEFIIEGKVRHANTHHIIDQVNIYIKNTNIGTISDYRGRFSLGIPDAHRNGFLMIEHVAYYPLEIPLSEALAGETYFLKPRIIQLPAVHIVSEHAEPEIMKDIPQSRSILTAQDFEIRGYVDAGDLLKTEHGIQVEEELSGKKTIGIRGGNPDDVVVLYNGVKLNNLYDNVFDLSLINLEDIRQLEIIRGSNTALYGAEANSGIVNIIPKTYSQYSTRMQQKIGTYAMGAWDIQLSRNLFRRLNLSYSYKQGGTKRLYAETDQENAYLENMKTFHTANLVYELKPGQEDRPADSFNIMFLHTVTEYENQYQNEHLDNWNQFVSARFTGNLPLLKRINISSAYQWLDEEQESAMVYWGVDRHVRNRTLNVNVDKQLSLGRLAVLLGYQFENGYLDYNDKRNIPEEIDEGVESAVLSRTKHGMVSILKLHVPTGSQFYKTTDIDLSYRRDIVSNAYSDVRYRNPADDGTIALDDYTWKESMLKFSSHLAAGTETLKLNLFLNYGPNFKFPTMFQQISSPSTVFSTGSVFQTTLQPERTNSTEIGFELTQEFPGHPKISGWKFSCNYFRNEYNNKLRMYYIPYSPIAYYDNVNYAEISGLEAKTSLFLEHRKITLEFGTSNYSISEKAAFPFKSEHKHIVNLRVEHAGYSVQLHGFIESEQFGWIRNANGALSEIILPGQTNLDIHASKMIELDNTQFFINFSGRNLIGHDFDFEGLTLRDRRYYFTFGFQY